MLPVFFKRTAVSGRLRGCARHIRAFSVSNIPRHIQNPASLLTMSPEVFAEQMKTCGVKRGFMIYDTEQEDLVVSHPLFQPFADQCMAKLGNLGRDFDEHEGVFFSLGKESGALMAAFVHKTHRGQGAGGVRLWTYDSVPDWICDGLRLSRGMSRKNALAGLWHGGGKGVIARLPDGRWKDRQYRDVLFREYGEFLTSLQGCYVSAEDLGVTVEDVAQMFSKTRFTVCLPDHLGGSGNPSIPTALGVVSAMEGALNFLGQSLREKRIAIMGCGNVGRYLIESLLQKHVGEIYAADCDPEKVEAAKSMFAEKPVEIELVPEGDVSALYDANADVVAPCAVGGVLNKTTIPNIKAPIVCGAANNQLLDEEADGKLMNKHKIVYVPDFLANRMGIVNCANEAYGYVADDPHINRHYGQSWENSLFNMTQTVLEFAEKEGIATAEAANKIADELIKEEHPIWGHRPVKTIKTLQNNGWASGDE